MRDLHFANFLSGSFVCGAQDGCLEGCDWRKLDADSSGSLVYPVSTVALVALGPKDLMSRECCGGLRGVVPDCPKQLWSLLHGAGPRQC